MFKNELHPAAMWGGLVVVILVIVGLTWAFLFRAAPPPTQAEQQDQMLRMYNMTNQAQRQAGAQPPTRQSGTGTSSGQPQMPVAPPGAGSTPAAPGR